MAVFPRAAYWLVRQSRVRVRSSRAHCRSKMRSGVSCPAKASFAVAGFVGRAGGRVEAHVVGAPRVIAMPIDEETSERGAEAALLRIGGLEDFQAQKLCEEVVQRILGIVMREAAMPDGAVERVTILGAKFLQRATSRGFVIAPQAGDQRPTGDRKTAIAVRLAHIV